MPTFSGEMLWPYVLRELPRKERKQLAEGARIPINSIGAYAVDALESDRPQDAIDVLEPRLSMPERHHDAIRGGRRDLDLLRQRFAFHH